MPEFRWRQLDAYYVNLDSRPDRNIHMHGELARVGLSSATRIRGILPSEYQGDQSKVAVMRNRTPGAIGCHYAQRSIIERGEWSGRNVLVMEDDLVFCSDMHDRLDQIELFLNGREWDIVWLGGTVHIAPAVWHKDTLGRDAERTIDDRIVRTYGAFCTYCYVVNGDSAGKVLRLLDENVHRSIGIDWLMIQIQPQLQTFMYLPGCVRQMDNQSNIGNGWTNFSHFAKLGPYWFQPRAEMFNPATFNFAEASTGR